MKRMIVMFGLLALLAVSAYAQEGLVNAKVPFEFVVSGKTLPAGNYVFKLSTDRLTVQNKDTGTIAAAMVMTKIAATAESKAVGITFDVSNGKHFIEAVWPMAGGDGYLIHMVKGEHTHEVVKPL